MKDAIPSLSREPDPDFSDGLAPLSDFVELALKTDHKLMFILDEFDELPRELLRRTDLSTSLFQPIRQVSNKPACGFLLVGGEGIQEVIHRQGDRITKFITIEIDYFSKTSNKHDFFELISRPVRS